jgi:hypothetical protein
VTGQRSHHAGGFFGDRRGLRGLGGHDRRRRGVAMVNRATDQSGRCQYNSGGAN